ncbi:MAG: ATP-binding protein, partial [Bacteroidota bacterium]
RFIDVNESMMKTLGYSREEMIGKTSGELHLFVNPELRQSIVDNILHNILVRDVEVEVNTKSGTVLTGLFSADKIYVGKDLCLLSMLVDITERKNAEKKLREAQKEAEMANHAKSEFLSRMSHELRTPMNSILGFSQLMEMGELTPMHRKNVGHILNSGKHLLNLINEVLDISRIEAGRIALSLEMIDPKPIILEMIDIVQHTPVGRDKEFVVEEFPGEDYWFVADRQRLKQVLLNLINNAVKYNRESGSVVIKTTPCKNEKSGESMIRIAISDTGFGIKPEDTHKLFQPFERIDADKTFTEGTGLGLMVVKKLTEIMNGKVGFESTPGVGSTFWIELPQATTGTNKRGQDEKLHATPSSFPEITGTILYIEDNFSNLELVNGIISSHRPQIRIISSIYGKDAVEMVRFNKPDLIFLDLNLPDINGNEVLANLKAEEISKSIPVIIISADAMPEQIDKLMLEGAVDYLTKPIDVIFFLKVVDQWLEIKS